MFEWYQQELLKLNRNLQLFYVKKQAQVVEKLDNAVHWINAYLVVNAIGSLPLDSGLFG